MCLIRLAGFDLHLYSMYLQLYDIAPQLQPYVKLICSMDFDGDADTSHICVLPDTCAELFINYTIAPLAVIGNELHRRSIVTFRMSRPMDVQMRKGAGCLAICFHPGMASPFFPMPMHELTDTATALTDVWSDMAGEIEDKLADAPDNSTRVAIVQHHLMQQLACNGEDALVTYCLRVVQSADVTLSVKQLCEKAGISQRHLARRFQQAVGLSPKAYLGVNRFIRSLQHLKQYPSRSLTDIAYQGGYYDQAHFIRDYKAYAGHTPGEVVQSGHILY